MVGALRPDAVPIILWGMKKNILKFLWLLFTFTWIFGPPLIWREPLVGICTNLIILEGMKEVVESSQLANFQEGSSLIFPVFFTNSYEILDPFYMSG